MRLACSFLLFSVNAFCVELSFIPVISRLPKVQSVELSGTLLKVALATQVGQPYDARMVAQDVRKLWATGRFEDIRVEQDRREAGGAVIFRVVEARVLRLRKLLIEPANLSLKVTLPEGSPMDRERAQAIARQARLQLNAQGYTNANVEPELVALEDGRADLHLTIAPGERIRVKRVKFTGVGAADSKELHRALQALAPRHVLGLPLHPDYSQEAAAADIVRVRSMYLRKGYFDARVQLAGTEIERDKAEVTIAVERGPLYRVQGSAPCDVCASLFRARRDAERQGILDYSPELHVERAEDGSSPLAILSTTVQRGTPYRVGRVQFLGNRQYSDARLRHDFLLEEGQVLDGRLLRKSIDRLNQSRRFEPIAAGQVVIHPTEAAGVADLIVKLNETKRGSWRLSGPVGPFSFAGPLEASVRSRLPPWGSGLFDLATYSASISMFAFARPVVPLLGVIGKRPLLPVLALARPYAPAEGWLSGFTLAPQLGWRAAAFTYSATQITQRTQPLLAGDRGLVPELQVRVEDPHGEGTIICEPPPPRLAKLRSVVGIGLRLLSAFSGM